MIQAYPRDPSVAPGQVLQLHVSTDHAAFVADFYRFQNGALTRMDGLVAEPCRGQDVPCGPTDEDWGWPSYRFEIPETWRSGVYFVVLTPTELSCAVSTPRPGMVRDLGDAAALFVIRSLHPGRDTPILYKLSWNTYQAYNGTGYGSLYAEPRWRDDPPAGWAITHRRPGGGIAGELEPGIVPLPYDEDAARQTFAYWDAPFISWLESEGYALDFCSDWDAHFSPELLEPYQLILSVGHDEYWTDQERANLLAFTESGGNMAFFSGNIESVRIAYNQSGSATRTTKGDGDDWVAIDPHRRLTGVVGQGGWWTGKPRPILGYTVANPNHWIFGGTDLGLGDTFGDDASHPLVGYEIDGVGYRTRHGYPVPTGEHGTPESFAILALAELDQDWYPNLFPAAATMGIYASPGGGLVFTGSVTDWPIVATKDAVVARITRNVLDRLSLPGLRVVGPLPTVAGRAIATTDEIAVFRADDANLEGSESYDWVVHGASIELTEGATVKVRMPAQPQPVTVDVTAQGEAGPVGFGSLTTFPYSELETLEFQLASGLRDMIIPREPTYPLAGARIDPLSMIGEFYPGTLSYLIDRAESFLTTAKRLESLRQDPETS